MSVRPAKTQMSQGIRPVWSVSSLSAWRNLGSLATHSAHSEDRDQTGRMPRLIWVFAGRTVTLLVLSYRGSFIGYISTFRQWFKHNYFIALTYTCTSKRVGPQVLPTLVTALPNGSWDIFMISARPRSAEYTIGICFETEKKTSWLDSSIPYENVAQIENLYSLKSSLWLAAVACVVRWPVSNALLNDIWLTRFTRMYN